MIKGVSMPTHRVWTCGKCGKVIEVTGYYTSGNPASRARATAQVASNLAHRKSAHVKAKCKDGLCYLSTACIRSANLPDDCYELQRLRWFRDHYVLTTEKGPALIREYYDIAPDLVLFVNNLPDPLLAWREVFSGLVQKSVKLIDDGCFEEALAIYYDFTRDLQTKRMGQLLAQQRTAPSTQVEH